MLCCILETYRAYLKGWSHIPENPSWGAQIPPGLSITVVIFSKERRKNIIVFPALLLLFFEKGVVEREINPCPIHFTLCFSLLLPWHLLAQVEFQSRSIESAGVSWRVLFYGRQVVCGVCAKAY